MRPRRVSLVALVCVLGASALGAQTSDSGSDTTAVVGGAADPKYTLDPVVVVGQPWRDVVETPRAASPGLETAVTVVPRAAMARQGAQTAMEALEYVPGGWIETRGRKVKQFFSIRGQKYPYPDYALDGAWQREFHELPYFFATADLERIQVVRSSAALVSGLSGLVGIVDLIPRRPDARETAAELEYGSFNSYRLHTSHGDVGRTWAYMLSGQVGATDGPEGRHAAEQMTHVRGSGYWEPHPTLAVQTHLFVLDGSRELAQALPPAGARFQNGLETFDPFRAALLTSSVRYAPDDRSAAQLQLSYADRRHTFVDEAPDPNVAVEEEDWEWTVNALVARQLSGRNTLRAGVLYNRWVAPNGKRFYVGRRCDLETYSAVVADEHRWGALVVDGGLRWARTYLNEYGAFNIDGSPKGLTGVEPIEDTWEPSTWTGTVGAAYYASQFLSLHASLGRGQVQPRSGSLDTERATPADEIRSQADVGVLASRPGWGEVAVTAFWLDQRDAIALSGQTAELEGRTMELYVNRDQDQLGLEVEGRTARVAGCVSGFANLTAMRSRAAAQGHLERNREMPRYVGAVGVYGTRRGLDLNMFAKYVSRYESTRFVAAPAGSAPVPEALGDFVSLGLTGSYTFAAYGTRLYWEMDNAADKAYATVPGYPDYGRRLAVGVRWVLR